MTDDFVRLRSASLHVHDRTMLLDLSLHHLEGLRAGTTVSTPDATLPVPPFQSASAATRRRGAGFRGDMGLGSPRTDSLDDVLNLGLQWRHPSV